MTGEEKGGGGVLGTGLELIPASNLTWCMARAI